MSIVSIFIIGIALAMDAFGVSLSVGVNKMVDRRTKIGYIMSFSFFQFLLCFIGGVLGYLFDNYIASIPNLLGGLVIAIVGIIMIVDGLKSKEDTILIKKSMIFILGISVSIDALVIGFTLFHEIGGIAILFIDCILVGLITLLLCTIAFIICKYIRKIDFISKYADFFGGIALILFAIKMIFF